MHFSSELLPMMGQMAIFRQYRKPGIPYAEAMKTNPTTTSTTDSTEDFDAEFFTLLNQWNRHQELRSAAAPISTLAGSRADLDEQRLTTYRLAS